MSTTTIELAPQGLQESQSPVQPFGPSTEEAIVQQKQKWNDPPINRWRLLATFISFTVVGANDGVYGLREDYKLSTTVVSLIFVTPFAGYTIATLIVNKIHMTLGQRGIAIIGPLCHIIPYVIMAIHPPWPAMLAVYVIVGLGNGLIDAAWNSWIADMANANAMMGVLQAFYGLGYVDIDHCRATISPLVGTQMIKSGLRWNYFYYTLLGGSVLELMVSSTLFWKENAVSYRATNHRNSDSGNGSRTTEAMKSPITWLIAVWLFVYMGVEVSVGGWVVDFMVQVRHGEPYQSGLIPTGFWAGVTVGRLVLGFVNDWRTNCYQHLSCDLNRPRAYLLAGATVCRICSGAAPQAPTYSWHWTCIGFGWWRWSNTAICCRCYIRGARCTKPAAIRSRVIGCIDRHMGAAPTEQASCSRRLKQ
ncbi:MFS transporter [Aspergillus niger CBS 101883]|uniref:MFS transporter n=1 Tax=Aspergillus lacticoffeatus (strain CBS 101883) TaxID=1450533 RepID=UPI000D7F5153|nr:MFS general substrate transporter [Aspergillus niger CBS 101883]PYH58622.1 MFS general substrate transporter [Aspergillus niger CBS 101883]